MKKQEMKMLGMIILIGVIVIGIIWLIVGGKNKEENKETEQNQVEQEEYVQVLEDGTKYNKSDKLKENKKLGGLEIGNIQLTHQNGMSVLLANVTNTTEKAVDVTRIRLKLYDDKGNVLEELDGLISPLKAGESTQLNMGVSADYANAYDFTIENR